MNASVRLQRQQQLRLAKQLHLYVNKLDRSLSLEGYNKKQRDKIVLQSLFEIFALKKQRELNEGLGDILSGIFKGITTGRPSDSFLSGLWKVASEQAARFVLEKLEIDPDSLLGSIISNAISEIEISDLTGIFEPGGCKKLVSHLSTAFEQVGIEKVADAVAEGFGLDLNSSIWKNWLKRRTADALSQTDFLKSIADGIGGAICDLDPSQLMNAVTQQISSKSGGKVPADKLSATLKNVEK